MRFRGTPTDRRRWATATAPAALATALVLLATACAPFVEVETAGVPTLSVPEETSLVVAADGGVLAELHAEQDRDIVPLDAIAPILRAAVVAVEDARFWEHRGVDARALGRAVIENAREGRVVQGGSTITQQLAKNLAVGDDVTLDRKLREAAIALRLEATLDKEEILERYLNTVYFGNGAYGVQTAARRYLGIDASEVDAAGAALLAGLIRAPSRYDPSNEPEAALRRRNVVLDVLGRRRVLDAETAAAARVQPLGVIAPAPERFRAPYFVAHVLKLLQHDPAFAVLGEDPADRADRIFRGGLRVETTLDPEWQDAAEKAIGAVLSEPDDPRAGLVALDPATGAIRALVGGRDYDDPDDPQARFNLATDGLRQPGSAFKPVVLAAALTAGHTLDERFPGGASVALPGPPPWLVRNYGDRDHGPVTLREATVHSVNVAYARLVNDIGAERVADMASALGIDRRLAPYPSLALGALEVSVLDMARVQATLAAGGIARPATAVRRIVAADDTVLYEQAAPEGERVLDEEVAALVTSTLGEVVRRGTGVRGDLQRPTAGKTGTTQHSADAWFAGYTPDLAAAVWVGFPDGVVPMVPPRTRLRVEGGNWPAEIFAGFGIRALAGVPAKAFPSAASDLVTVRVDPVRDCLPTIFTPPTAIEERELARGTEPDRPCRDQPAPIDVPEVVGQPITEAVRVLEDAGLSVVQRPQFSPTYPPGYVLAQDPAAGPHAEPDRGYEIRVWVSTADRTPVTVPDVLGMSEPDARRILEDGGFVVVAEEGCPGGAATCSGARHRAGRVWEQRPDAGTAAPVHSVITLAVSPSR